MCLCPCAIMTITCICCSSTPAVKTKKIQSTPPDKDRRENQTNRPIINLHKNTL